MTCLGSAETENKAQDAAQGPGGLDNNDFHTMTSYQS
ncbi:hypothetical protein KL86CLO1_11898 [uncultured Eubacteriales bacterium]|uniref:Uncharacterized protein n=1 Tax=uncultured Eubacteriales bacterium TaxID=172733 RepID=A0A212JY55_9FIRM|nr:hypothetical protein KL86CLO1_11898 [uncultured Eubacteriales bacterium]